jgi:hypothetical protein
MRKVFLFLPLLCAVLCFASCATQDWTYETNISNAVILRVSGNNGDHTYRMWLATPGTSTWGEAVVTGNYSMITDRDVDTGHKTTIVSFHSTSGGTGDIGAVDSLKRKSSLLEVFAAVNSTIRGAVCKALTSDQLELQVDNFNGDAQFKCPLLPLNIGLVADRVQGRLNKHGYK